MTSQFLIDYLTQILEYLEEDKATLFSCLLVNRLWCRISVKILWKDFRIPIKGRPYYYNHNLLPLTILINCLPNESKDLIHKKPILKTPLFNYVSFLKVLSIPHLLYDNILYDDKFDVITNCLITEEILKMSMKQIPSLKSLDVGFKDYYDFNYFPRVSKFINFPGTKDCLKNLSELKCSSNLNSDFFCQLSKICHNIQSLEIYLFHDFSNGLKNLILSLNNLKSLTFIHPYYYDKSDKKDWSTFLIAHTFPHLEILRLLKCLVEVDVIIKFLENNGKNLKEFYVEECNNSLNLAIAEFCPNLKSLYTLFSRNEIEILKTIFENCQQLETIITICGDFYLEIIKFLGIVAKYSPKNFHELKLCYHVKVSKDFRSFFTSWKARIPQIPISLIFKDDYSIDIKTSKMIARYRELGVIKKFESKSYQELLKM
jgi:hypothetical protein